MGCDCSTSSSISSSGSRGSGCCSNSVPCDPYLPEGCEALGNTAEAARLVVEDAANCKYTLAAPETPSFLISSPSIQLAWRDGSASKTIPLNNLQSQDGGSVPKLLVFDADAEMAALSPSAAQAEPQVLVGDNTGWTATERSQQFGTGSGLLVRELASPSQASWQTGTPGQIPYVGDDGEVVFGDASSVIPAGSIDGMNLRIERTGNDTINIYCDFVTLRNISSAGLRICLDSINVSVSRLVSGAGGIDVGSVGAGVIYWAYVIYNPTTLTKAGILSTNSGNPTLPSGYTYYRKVGAATTTGTSIFSTFSQMGNEWQETPFNSSVASNTTLGLSTSSVRYSINTVSGSLTIPAPVNDVIAVYVKTAMDFTTASSTTARFSITNASANPTDYHQLGITVTTSANAAASGAPNFDSAWVSTKPNSTTIPFVLNGTYGTHNAGEGVGLAMSGYRWNFIG